jgi:hypothetical protein
VANGGAARHRVQRRDTLNGRRRAERGGPSCRRACSTSGAQTNACRQATYERWASGVRVGTAVRRATEGCPAASSVRPASCLALCPAADARVRAVPRRRGEAARHRRVTHPRPPRDHPRAAESHARVRSAGCLTARSCTPGVGVPAATSGGLR